MSKAEDLALAYAIRRRSKQKSGTVISDEPEEANPRASMIAQSIMAKRLPKEEPALEEDFDLDSDLEDELELEEPRDPVVVRRELLHRAVERANAKK